MATASTADMREHLALLLASAVKDLAPDLTPPPLVLERPKQAAHGDYACNVAMQLAKPLKRSPRQLAESLVRNLAPSPWLEKAEVAGAGFINLFLRPEARREVVRRVLTQGAAYGHVSVGKGQRVQVEFVSANPTGPLHVGHGRGAAFGASVANVLAAAGFQVQREFYTNDAGRQMDILALSTWLRYLELAGCNVTFPENAYRGAYVKDMARQVMDAHGHRHVRDTERLYAGAPAPGEDDEARLDVLIANARRILGDDWTYFHQLSLTEQLADCRNDLTEFGVVFDNWFSERSLFESGLVDLTLARLEQAGHLYQQDGATWFRSTHFGDEKDRVVRRENGQFTYFASDIAYHLNKFERGFNLVVDVWGADHHGYIPRVKGALQALGLDPERLVVALVQFAVLYRGGVKVQMSTRAGEFVTLRELRREVGNDAARFFYVLRKGDQHLDFDLDLAKSQSTDNPVYYVQYAHARVCSVLEQWGGEPDSLAGVDLAALESRYEHALLNLLMDFAPTIEAAARELSPHLLAFYLRDLAAAFHSYYNAEQFLVSDERLRLARLALVTAVRQVIRNGMGLLGVSCPERM